MQTLANHARPANLWKISTSIANLVFSLKTPFFDCQEFYICGIYCFEDRYLASVAEWVRRESAKLYFVGSIPTAGSKSKIHSPNSSVVISQTSKLSLGGPVISLASASTRTALSPTVTATTPAPEKPKFIPRCRQN
jgi:hypothetical protein